jgi:hypothetical protein
MDMAMMMLLGEFFDQFGIAFCFAVAMVYVAVAIYALLIKRHSLGATAGFVAALVVGALVIGTAIHALV